MSAEVMQRLRAAAEGTLFAEGGQMPELVREAREWLENMNPEAGAGVCVKILRGWPTWPGLALRSEMTRVVAIRFFESFPDDFSAGAIRAGLEVVR